MNRPIPPFPDPCHASLLAIRLMMFPAGQRAQILHEIASVHAYGTFAEEYTMGEWRAYLADVWELRLGYVMPAARLTALLETPPAQTALLLGKLDLVGDAREIDLVLAELIDGLATLLGHTHLPSTRPFPN